MTEEKIFNLKEFCGEFTPQIDGEPVEREVHPPDAPDVRDVDPHRRLHAAPQKEGRVHQNVHGGRLADHRTDLCGLLLLLRQNRVLVRVDYELRRVCNHILLTNSESRRIITFIFSILKILENCKKMKFFNAR